MFLIVHTNEPASVWKLAMLAPAAIASIPVGLIGSSVLSLIYILSRLLPPADRYYRLTATGPNSTAADAQRASDAFKNVALTWMARNQV